MVYMDVGYNGTDYCETPNIDRLAKEGTSFTNAYAAGANCTLSRACLISSLYTSRHEVNALGRTLHSYRWVACLKLLFNKVYQIFHI